MNKKLLLAGILPAIVFADLAHAAEIYNKYGTKADLYAGVNARRLFTDGDSEDRSLADIGFYGESKITSDITGYGFWQTRITEGMNEWSEYAGVRQQYAGIRMKDYGSLDYGRSFGILYDIGKYTDIAPYFSGETWNANSDNFLANRGSSMLTYRNSDFFGVVKGLEFALQYQFKNREGWGDIDKVNGEGYGASVGYEIIRGLTVKGVYNLSERTDRQNATEGQGDKDAKAWGIGTLYYTNNLYLAGVYSETQNMTLLNSGSWTPIVHDQWGGHAEGDTVYWLNTADKFKNLELVAQYQFNNGFRPSISYVKAKVEDEIAGNYDFAEYIQAGFIYKITGSSQVWFDHRFSLNDAAPTGYNGVVAADESAAGIIFMF